MNEDERGITPRDVTAITVELVRDSPNRFGRLWGVTIEQGNGDVLKTFELTDMERVQLGNLLFADPPWTHCSFIDFARDRKAAS